MLDTTTKRRIDSLRDILVGKVPDPKSQVEQITIALIYKFMDDMDAEAEELGGKRKFFAGEFARYGWPKLMHAGLGGNETLNLYAEAISKMPENPGIPPLFREIFKNAYLPYRDPETLKSFLKIIDQFDYDHSEKLGDAYEHLLQVLGSQGDAGQFRTPRNIIEFIVDVVDPKKDESILDPACGTAGFLISAYKHILEANRDGDGNSTLTPEEKKRLAGNVKGYDISPDMVRLSLVNLYLHGFTAPNILEYDTLTTETRWGETSDVIFANPPFMSPKGGIKPHRRFSIQAKRSEVLFVDYIAEHLSPNGRAGIIVPEGIIFQSQTAYVALRKLLVENSLVAVISLPAGVFNPYSGVKTSILILDKSLAQQATSIGFFKIENDGFSLGAQRRENNKNDLPQVKAEIDKFLNAVRNHQSSDELKFTTGQIVAKTKLAASGDYNLSGERYREGVVQSQNFPLMTIETLVETITPPTKIQKSAFGLVGRFPIIDQSQDDIAGWTDDETALIRPKKPLVIFGDHTCAVKLIEVPFAQGADGIKILQTIDTLEPRFLYYVLHERPLETSGYQRHYSKLKEYQIPLPPLDVQKEIVAEIEGYQKVITGARAVLDNYRPQIEIDPKWPKVELADVIEDLKSGVSVNSENRLASSSEWGVLKTSAVTSGVFDPSEHKTILPNERGHAKCSPKQGSIIISRMNTESLVGASAYVDRDYPTLFLPDRLWQTVFSRKDVSPRFIHLIISSERYRAAISAVSGGTSGSMKNISKTQFLAIKVPIPSLETQLAIVNEIEAEQALVAANRELIARFEKKIQATLSRVWGEERPTPSDLM